MAVRWCAAHASGVSLRRHAVLPVVLPSIPAQKPLGHGDGVAAVARSLSASVPQRSCRRRSNFAVRARRRRALCLDFRHSQDFRDSNNRLGGGAGACPKC
jgi:hypothetical protein